MYEKVEKLAAAGMNDVPEQIKKKKMLFEKITGEVQNYLNYIKMGNFSKAVSEALKEAETRGENLKEEVAALEFQKSNTFKAPPREWIKDRLENLHETLNMNTKASSAALKAILGTIQLEPVSQTNEDVYNITDNGEGFKPYYMAHTKIKTLALLDDRYKGSNWSRWWTGEDCVTGRLVDPRRRRPHLTVRAFPPGNAHIAPIFKSSRRQSSLPAPLFGWF